MTRLKRPDGNRGGRREAVDLGRRIDYISVASSTDRPLWPPRYAQADELDIVLIDRRGAELVIGVNAPADLSTWLLLPRQLGPLRPTR